MAKICVYTFDGTASGMPKAGGGFNPGAFDTDTKPGGAFPQAMASMLQNYDSSVWQWKPVDYQPYTTLTEGHALRVTLARARNYAIPDILAQPAGTKFVLSGLSQGSFATGMMYREFTNPSGALYGRRGDLVGVVNFGDALRPRGWTVPLKGITDPGGYGVLGGAKLVQSWGTSTGVIENPPYWYLSFAQPGDPAACTDLDPTSRLVMDAFHDRLMLGSAPNTNYVWGAPADPSKNELENLVYTITTLLNELRQYQFSNVPQLDWLAVLNAIPAIMNNWFGFLGAGLANGLGLTWLGNLLNPHEQYHIGALNQTFPYKAIGGNNRKSAVTLGYEWCVENLTAHVKPPTTVIDTKVNVYETPGTNPTAPIFYPPVDVQKLPFNVGLDKSTFTYNLMQDHLNAIYPLNSSVHQGTAYLAKKILNTPGKFVLVGTSQGAMISSKIFQAMTTGPMQGRLADCLGVFNYGNPLRQSGTAFPGATSVATGHGIAPANQRLTNTSSIVWEFANQGDPVCCNGDDANSQIKEDVFEALQSRWRGLIASLGSGLLFIEEVIALFSPKPGEGLLAGMAVYHNEYGKWKPISGDNRTDMQIAIDYLNSIAGPRFRADGWSTVLSPPAA